MTVKEFCDYYEKGLGRAIIGLKSIKDKEPYKKAFLEMISDEKTRYRVLDIYEKEILDIFDDAEFTNRLAERFIEELREQEDINTAIPLLILLGYRETVTDIIENLYKESYAQLLEYTKKPWDGERYPPFARNYMTAAGRMGRYLKVGDERIKKILFDIADLYDYCQYPVIPTYQNPLYQLWDGMGKEHFFNLLDEVIAEHRNGKKIDIRNEIVFGDDIEKDTEKREIPAVTIDDILSTKEFGRLVWPHLEAFYNGDEQLQKAVAHAAIDEKDIAKQEYLLRFFTVRLYSEENEPVEFPLDLIPSLVKLAEDVGFSIPEQPLYGITKPVLQILENKKCQTAHDVGMRLYYDNSISQRLRNYAISIRFGKNYIPQIDKSDFVALLLSNNAADKCEAMRVFVDDIKNDIEDLPLDMIPYVFANISPQFRNEFCELLAEKDLMPEELKEECLFDFHKHTRELFMKTKKPKKVHTVAFLAPPDMPE